MQSLVGVVAGIFVLILTIELLRRHALREKYAVLWLLISLIGVTFTVFPGVLEWVSSKLGFNLPSNLVFALAALVLLVVGMQLSLEVGRLEDRSQRLAEEIALLRHDLEALEARRRGPVQGDGGSVAPGEPSTGPTAGESD
jgi:hypothetical protein